MKLLSFDAIRRDNWLLRASILGSENILIVLYNEVTFETEIRSFTNEILANMFIEYTITKHLLKDEYDE